MKNHKIPLAIIAALFGVIFLLAGTGLTVIAYNHHNPAPYYFTNHFVSELGWTKSSPKAALFNWSLAVGNLALFPMLLALSRHIQTRLGYVAAGFGICTILASGGVGMFPMDNLQPHIWVALICFGSWFLATLFFTLAFCPRWNARPSFLLVAVGIICCLINGVFLALPKDSLVKALQHLDSFQRPNVWGLAVCEWGVVLSSWIWASSAGWVLWREKHYHQNSAPIPT